MENTEELLRCPCCGGMATVLISTIACDNCLLTMGNMQDESMDVAIAAWNRRENSQAENYNSMGAFSWIEAREGLTAMFWAFLGGCVVGAVAAWLVSS